MCRDVQTTFSVELEGDLNRDAVIDAPVSSAGGMLD